MLPCTIDASRPANESAPCVCMVSIIMARAPLPENGFIRAVGSASTQRASKPSARTAPRIAPISSSSAPLARNTAIATSMATRYGMMVTAV